MPAPASWSCWRATCARTKRTEAAAIARAPIDPYARSFIYYFALVPLIVVTVFAVISGKSDLSGMAPLLVLSGLAIVVAGGDTIMLHHQRILSIAWFALLLLPPVLVAAGVLLLPAVFAVDLKVAQPADEIARSSPRISSAAPAASSKSWPAIHGSRR